MPHDVMLSNNTKGEVGRGGLLLRDWLDIGRLVVSNSFHSPRLSFLGFIFPLFSLQFFIVIISF